MYTIAVHNGSSARRLHNIRDFCTVIKEPHIQIKGDYEIWCDEKPREAYDRLFGKAVVDYNNKQQRSDRKITDYYKQICNDKKKHAVYECIVGVYSDKDSEPLPLSLNKKILKDYVQDWKRRNPNLEMIGAYYHNDEQGKQPHVHIDYVPVAHGYKRGMNTQTAIDRALREQGFIKQGKVTPQIKWADSERDALEELCKLYAAIDISHPQAGKGVKHLHTEAYKAQQDLFAIWEQLDEAKRELESLPDISEESRRREELLRDIKQAEIRLQELKPSLAVLNDLGQQYNNLITVLKKTWEIVLQSQVISGGHVPIVYSEEISRRFGHKETIYTISKSDAQAITTLCKNLTPTQMRAFNSAINTLPEIRKSLSFIYNQGQQIQQILDSSIQQKTINKQSMVIDSLQEELQQKDRDLQELQKLKQFIEKYHPDWQKELEQQQQDKEEVQLHKMDFEHYSR